MDINPQRGLTQQWIAPLKTNPGNGNSAPSRMFSAMNLRIGAPSHLQRRHACV